MSQITKRKKGQMLNNSERQLILNLMTYLRGKDSGKSVSEIIREISKATGCSERTIYKIKKEASKGITVAPTRTRHRKKENKNSRHVKYDSYVKSSIRKKIHNHFLQNNSPTLNTILCLVNSDPNLPKLKRSTLHTLLKEIGFMYEQKGNKSLLTESKDLVAMRQTYLRDVRRYREENRWIVYLGETVISLVKTDVAESQAKCQNLQEINTLYINPNGTLLYTVDANGLGILTQAFEITNALIPTETQTQIEDKKETSGNKTDNRELRFLIMHAGCDQGFLQDADHITISKRRVEDVEKYNEWFLEKLLPKIPPNSVIVTDNNNTFDSSMDENFPTNSWRKQQIKNWLESNNIQVEGLSQKKDLLSVAEEVRPLYSKKYKINEMAKERGIVIVSLPPFHYELNPLNLIWPHIKTYVRSNVKRFKVKKIKQVIRDGFYSVSQLHWMNCVQSVREMEGLLWTVDEQNLMRESFGSEREEKYL